MLWYIGFDANSQGQIVYVNGGAIDIYMGCTAVPLFLKLLQFSFLILLLFRSLCRNLSLLLILPAILSLVFSIIRLAIMALVVNNPEAFEFWHGIEGGNLFMTIALVMFFGILFLMEPPQEEGHSPADRLPPSPPPTPLWLLRSSSVVLLLILFNFMVGSPVAGANAIAEYNFPLALDLPSLREWELKHSESEALIKAENNRNNEPEGIEFNHPLSTRSYFYQKGNDIFNDYITIYCQYFWRYSKLLPESV